MFRKFLNQSVKASNGERVRMLKTSNKDYKNREGQIFVMTKLWVGDYGQLSGIERGGITNSAFEANRAISLGRITRIHDNGIRLVIETDNSTYLLERVGPEEF